MSLLVTQSSLASDVKERESDVLDGGEAVLQGRGEQLEDGDERVFDGGRGGSEHVEPRDGVGRRENEH